MNASWEYAEESVDYGNTDATTGNPDPASLTFVPFRANHAEILPVGEVPAQEDEIGGDGFHEEPPVPDTVDDSGTPVRRRTGAVSLNLPWEFLGAGAGAVDAISKLVLFKCLATAMKAATAPGGASDSATGVSVNTLTPFGAANYQAGGLFAVMRNGRMEGGAISQVDGGTPLITYTPATTAILGAASNVRLCQVLYVAGGSDAGSVEKSLCFRMQRKNFRQYAAASRLTSAAMSLTGRGIRWALTMDSQHIEDDHDNYATVDPIRLPGGDGHLRKCYVTVSDAEAVPSGTTPMALGRLDLALDALTITLTPEWAEGGRGTTETLIGIVDQELVGFRVEIDMTISTPVAALDADFWGRKRRNLLITVPPFGAGKGAVIFAQAVFLRSWTGGAREFGKNYARQRLVLGCGKGSGDGGNASYASGPINSPFRIGWVMPE